MTTNHIKSALEAMMFIWGEPLSAKDAAEVLNEDWEVVHTCFQELQKSYDEDGRGIRIRQVEKAFQFVSHPDYSDYIERLCTPIKRRRLSQAALEVLAIVAYKQPATKGEIDSIRGIKSDRVMEGLMSRELVKEVGRANGIGRPILYGTTENFLKYFGFTSIKELPEIEDIEGAIQLEDNYEDVDPRQIQIDLAGDNSEDKE